jgi:hypothetical protein
VDDGEVGAPAPHSALCPPPPPPGCDAGTSHPPPPPPCGVPSAFGGDDPWRGLWDPDDLPLLKNQLELRLEELRSAERVVVDLRNQVEGHLRDVATAEDAVATRHSEQ